jgi:hypothetical protein
MRKLDRHGDFGMRANRSQRGLQRRLGGTIPKSQAARCDAAIPFNGGCLDKQKTRARKGEPAEVNGVPCVRLAIVGDVLAHRRHDNPVGKLEGSQCLRRKQRAHESPSVSDT